ncbi:hypothetical protein BDV96DRAFT_146022 [Lophiotrema nucula]|uniref:Transmembrane protein n=1 Tax=Lophiotrema nucula TaxID=690887 RepID=A0A6A5Z0H4_9PLEO|nr:hypothetical protein BDV96DRAFT_146022 [Lophiotrema nucula]
MPPPSIPTGLSRISNLSASNGFTHLPKIFLLALVVATCVRAVVLHCFRRKRTIEDPCQVRQEKDSATCQVAPKEDLRRHRYLEDKNPPPPTFRPIYPWVLPPQELPGPYEPRLYPLPSIRRHSYEPSHAAPMEMHSASYSRRVSTNSIPTQHSTLRGTVTVSSNGTNGWRRNQWVVGGD